MKITNAYDTGTLWQAVAARPTPEALDTLSHLGWRVKKIADLPNALQRVELMMGMKQLRVYFASGQVGMIETAGPVKARADGLPVPREAQCLPVTLSALRPRPPVSQPSA